MTLRTYSRKNMTMAPNDHGPALENIDSNKRRCKNGMRLPALVRSGHTIHGDSEQYRNFMSKKKQNEQKRRANKLRKRAADVMGIEEGKKAPMMRNQKAKADGGALDRQETHYMDLNIHDQMWKKLEDIVTNRMGANSSPSTGGEASETSNQMIKVPYIRKQYLATPTPVPDKNLFNRRISGYSKESKFWSLNQSSSPLLRLPEKVRTRIYEYVLGGGNTIAVVYHTWRTYEEGGHIKSVAEFKFHARVYDCRTDPWAKDRDQTVNFSEGFTLLSRVSRQLHQETAVLPYRLNRWAFYDYHTMWNFLVVFRKMSWAQRKAITEIVVPDQLPGTNLLQHMGGLKKVYLAEPLLDGLAPKGWYRVVEGTLGRDYIRDWTYTVLN